MKLSFAKKGLRLFKGLRLLILEKIYKAMFIQGATFIREVRVIVSMIEKYQPLFQLTFSKNDQTSLFNSHPSNNLIILIVRITVLREDCHKKNVK